MSLFSRLRLRSHDFATDTCGSMPVEGMMASTLLVWWYVASFQFFDAFRQKNTNLKAAYTIADLVSRQSNAVDADYVEGLNTLFDYLTHSRRPTWVRVTSVLFDEDEDKYEVAWSYATGSAVGHSDASIDARRDRIPVMPAGDTIILVETNMAFDPVFRVGLNAQWFQTFIPTRPRFAACVPWDKADGTIPACIYDSNVDPDGEVHDDGTTVISSDDDEGDGEDDGSGS